MPACERNGLRGAARRDRPRRHSRGMMRIAEYVEIFTGRRVKSRELQRFFARRGMPEFACPKHD